MEKNNFNNGKEIVIPDNPISWYLFNSTRSAWTGDDAGWYGLDRWALPFLVRHER